MTVAVAQIFPCLVQRENCSVTLCDLIGDCVHIFGQECVEADFCCVKDDSTPEVSSTTQNPDDCDLLCDGVDIGFVGTCCGKNSDK